MAVLGRLTPAWTGRTVMGWRLVKKMAKKIFQNCNYEANPRYCTFANSWSTPCREHSTCLYLCTVLLLRLVHET